MLNHPTISLTAEVLRPTQVEVNLLRLTANYHALQRLWPRPGRRAVARTMKVKPFYATMNNVL